MTSQRIPGQRLLHAPGPTHVPEAVLQAMNRASMDLADPRLATIIADCEQGLRWLAGAAPEDAALLYSSNGHGMWECLIENLLPPGGTVLVPGTGHFSDGWAEQCTATGRTALRTPYREGHPIDAAAVEQALRDDREQRIAAVFVVHTDTASSVTSDLIALRAALARTGHPALFVVDAVATLGAVPLSMQADGIDVLMSASQKGLMLPPGLGVALANERALERVRANPSPRYYWDMARRLQGHGYHKFCGTPPLHLLYGLQASLALMQQEGLAAIHARHRLLAGAVWAAVEGWRDVPGGGRLEFLCQVPAARSVSVTAIRLAEGLDPEALRTVARERFAVAMAGGLGPWHGRVFRIGHLGDLNPAMILGAIAGVEAALRYSGVAVGPGAQRAIEFLARAEG